MEVWTCYEGFHFSDTSKLLRRWLHLLFDEFDDALPYVRAFIYQCLLRDLLRCAQGDTGQVLSGSIITAHDNIKECALDVGVNSAQKHLPKT